MSEESKEKKSDVEKIQQPLIKTYTPLPQNPDGYLIRRKGIKGRLRQAKHHCNILGGKKKTRKRKRKKRRRKKKSYGNTRRKRGRGKTRKKRQKRKRHRRTRRKKAGCWPFCLKKPQVLEDDPSRPLLQGNKSSGENKQESSWAEGLSGHKPDDLYMDRQGNVLNNETGEKTDKGWNQSERYILPFIDKRDNKYYKRLRKYGQG